MENREYIFEYRPISDECDPITLEEKKWEAAQREEKERDLDVCIGLKEETALPIYKCLPLYRAAISDEWEAAQRLFQEKEIDLDEPTQMALSDEKERDLDALPISQCIPLYKAAISNNWEDAERFFEEKKIDLDDPITLRLQTALHIAVTTNRSHCCVEKLIERITTQSGNREMLRAPDKDGDTPLHYAAEVGNTTAARLLINQDSELSHITNKGGRTALNFAAYMGWKDTLCYLLEVTKDVVDAEDRTGPYRGEHGADLLTFAIEADCYDVALYLVNKYPDLVMEENKYKETALARLATKPNAFKSGRRLGFWQGIIYKRIPVNREKALQSDSIPNLTKSASCGFRVSFWSMLQYLGIPVNREKALQLQGGITNQNLTKASYGFKVSFWSMLQYLAPRIKQLHDSKVKHIQAEELVKLICSTVMNKSSHDVAWDILTSAIVPAVKHGIYELMEQCLDHYPALAWYETVEGGNFAFAAIRERQENIYNLVYQISWFKAYAARFTHDKENVLHVAGKLAPPHRLNIVTGAALQMQRELQWFKEIENCVHPRLKEDLNKDNKTPRMVFTSAHEELLYKAQQWMKDTASSATVVASLIITVAFAAIFTAPGGNNDNGKPLLLNDGVFILFVISDAVALFSSSSSVLMFLSILSSCFAEEDFLYALPKRLTIGLISLFISLSATMIAFSATLSLMMRDKIQWIAAPVMLLASVPVTLFMLLQYPLLVELVRSTYGRRIFYKQNDLLLH